MQCEISQCAGYVRLNSYPGTKLFQKAHIRKDVAVKWSIHFFEHHSPVKRPFSLSEFDPFSPITTEKSV